MKHPKYIYTKRKSYDEPSCAHHPAAAINLSWLVCVTTSHPISNYSEANLRHHIPSVRLQWVSLSDKDSWKMIWSASCQFATSTLASCQESFPNDDYQLTGHLARSSLCQYHYHEDLSLRGVLENTFINPHPEPPFSCWSEPHSLALNFSRYLIPVMYFVHNIGFIGLIVNKPSKGSS